MARAIRFIAGFGVGLAAMAALLTGLSLSNPLTPSLTTPSRMDAPEQRVTESVPDISPAPEVGSTETARVAVTAPDVPAAPEIVEESPVVVAPDPVSEAPTVQTEIPAATTEMATAEAPVSKEPVTEASTIEDPAPDAPKAEAPEVGSEDAAPAPDAAASLEDLQLSAPGLGPPPEETSGPMLSAPEAAVKAPESVSQVEPDTAPLPAAESEPAPNVMTSSAPKPSSDTSVALNGGALSALEGVTTSGDAPVVAIPAEDGLPAAAATTDEQPPTPTADPAQPESPTDGQTDMAMLDPSKDETPVADVPAVAAPDQSDRAVAPDDSIPPAAPVLNGPAFKAFAAEFTPKEGRPMLSIILQDVGDQGVAREDLLEVSRSFTFALTPDMPRAQWADHAYREAGFEVVVMVPEGGGLAIGQRTPEADIRPYIRAYLDAVPGAIGLIDRPLGDLYRNIRVVQTLTDILKQSGRGLIVHHRFGVNATLQVADSNEVPAGTILRVIDVDRDPDVIRMALERATLQANKSGSAIVFGRTYPETVTTLISWLFSNSARSIDIAPLTAVVNSRTQ